MTDLLSFFAFIGLLAVLAVAAFVLARAQPRAQQASVRFAWAIGRAVNKTAHRRPNMQISITNEQKIPVTLAPVTATGKPAPLDGQPTWEVTSGSATLEVAEDGRSAFLISGDEPGDSIIVVKADADIGEGVEEISDAIRLTVQGARAQSLGLSIGTPVQK